jgi:hypothetical protein
MMRALSRYRYRIANQLHRLRRALAYATGRLSTDDAQDIILDCREDAAVDGVETGGVGPEDGRVVSDPSQALEEVTP